MPQLPLTVKTFTDYPQQLALLKQRGMIIDDEARCLRKLQQVSYYRLSGYYYVARQFHPTEYHTIGSCRVSTGWMSYNYLKSQYLLEGCKSEILEFLQPD